MKPTRRKPQNTVPRTLKRLRDVGWIAEVCERWISYGGQSGIRKDLFGLFDVLAFEPYGRRDAFQGVMAVQCCHADRAAEHIRKMMNKQELSDWISRYRWIEVHGWSKRANNRWVCNVWSIQREADGTIKAERFE